MWAGTATNGWELADNCAGWTYGGMMPTIVGSEDRTSATDDKWTNTGSTYASECSTKQRLDCFEIPTPE